MQFSFRSLSKDLSVCFQGQHTFGWTDEWTWPGLWSSSNTCPMRPCPSRNRISRSSHPVALTGWPSTGSSLHSSWHAMTWDEADFNPFLWEVLQPVHMEGGPKEKKIYWPIQVRPRKKILLYPWFHPALRPSILTRERQGDKNKNMAYSLLAEAWTWTAEVKYTLRNVAFTLMLESPKETVQRCDCIAWDDGEEFPQALFSRANWTSAAFWEFRK